MTPAAVLPARPGQTCPCGAPAAYGLLWRQPPGSRPALRHALACARCAPPEVASWAPPAVALDPLPPSAGPTRPPPVDLPSSPGEGEAAERSAAPVEAQTEPPAVAVAESEVAGRDLPAQEPLATAGGQPSTPDPWDGPEGRTYSEPQEAPVARAATLPPVDPVVPPGRCRLLGCATPSNVRGLCLPHYDLARRKGQLDELALPPIPRGRGTRFQRPAESAPSTRPQRAPRTRRAGAAAAAAPRHEGEALRAIWVALGSPELAQSESMDLEILRAAEQRLRLDAQLASRITELEEDGLRLRAQLDGQIQLTTDRVLERERARADADALRARVEELEGLLARKMKIQQETMRADVAEKRFESLRCALEQIAGYAPSPHLPDEVLIRESSEGVAWLRQELEAARGQIAALENSGREGDAAAEELARALGTFALPLLEVARRASAQILEAASRIADLRTALAEVADNDPDERTDAGLIAAATSEVQRLRVDAQLASRIRELEEDGVRLRSRLTQLQQEIATLSQDLAVCELVLDGEEDPPVEEGEVAARVLGLREDRDRLQTERADALSRVADLRGALAEIVDQDLDGQTDADLIAAATSEVQRLREGWRWAAEDARQTAQALDVARRQVVAAPETPESLERRYQALQTARRLRDLLEGRESPTVLSGMEAIKLQEIWFWRDILSPLIPGEIERLEREAGVSRG